MLTEKSRIKNDTFSIYPVCLLYSIYVYIMDYKTYTLYVLICSELATIKNSIRKAHQKTLT